MDAPVELADRQTTEAEMGTKTEGWGQEVWLILIRHHVTILIGLKFQVNQVQHKAMFNS